MNPCFNKKKRNEKQNIPVIALYFFFQGDTGPRGPIGPQGYIGSKVSLLLNISHIAYIILDWKTYNGKLYHNIETVIAMRNITDVIHPM